MRTGLSLPEELWKAAQPRIKEHYCSSFSEYVAELIRQDVLEAERRKFLMASTATGIAETRTQYAPGPQPTPETGS
jgi:metal-responsive CopG/Arc/MetJ family transcriptional regulator